VASSRRDLANLMVVERRDVKRQRGGGASFDGVPSTSSAGQHITSVSAVSKCRIWTLDKSRLLLKIQHS
jgi:hypothetical protein